MLLHALPVYHVHGLFVATHCALLAGARMLWLPKFDAREVCALLPRATVMMGVPTFYTRLLAEASFTRDACRSIRLFVSGSAPLLAETFDAFRERTGHAILERYGMTEAGMITSNPLEGARVGGTVGRPLPGVDVRIVDEPAAPAVPRPSAACRCAARTCSRATGRCPTRRAKSSPRTATSGPATWAQWVGDGPARGYLRLVGRAKDLIITGGLNVYPKEIEERIDQMDGVEESAVVGMPDPDFGEAVAAVIVRKPGHTVTEAGIIAALRGEIAHFKMPKRVIFEDALPRNAMGKVQKAALREKLAG